MTSRRARGRPVHGILLLDKPTGVRSNAALQRVKWLYRARKAGHTGALDNPASGLLPICLGEATKLSRYLLDADKRYLADFHLGVCTETGDAEGSVRARMPVPELDGGALRQVLAGFEGPSQQIPPMYSAIKRGGQRLHELAYQGKEIEREPRPIVIHSLTLLHYRAPVLGVEVCCSKGTYIRALAEDVGEALGCGAHVSMLRRIAVGAFEARDMITLERVEAASEEGLEALDRLLLPLDRAVEAMPRMDLEARGAVDLCRGQALRAPESSALGLVRLYGARGEFLGVGEVTRERTLVSRRLMAQAE